MALIVATYDSESKTLNVTIDGEDQGPMCCFSCCSEKDEDGYEGYCHMESESSKMNGVTHRHSAYASLANKSQEVLQEVFKKALSGK